MATILAYTSPAMGHLFPMTPLLLELQARGHDVHLRTIASRVDLMRDLGLRTEAVDPAIHEVIHPDWEASNPKQALEVAISTFCERGAIDGPDFQKALDEVSPDTVLVDINAWGALNVAEAWGGPWTVFSPYTADQLRRNAVVRPLVIGAAEKTMTPRINALRADYGLAPVHSADEYFRRAPSPSSRRRSRSSTPTPTGATGSG